MRKSYCPTVTVIDKKDRRQSVVATGMTSIPTENKIDTKAKYFKNQDSHESIYDVPGDVTSKLKVTSLEETNSIGKNRTAKSSLGLESVFSEHPTLRSRCASVQFCNPPSDMIEMVKKTVPEENTITGGLPKSVSASDDVTVSESQVVTDAKEQNRNRKIRNAEGQSQESLSSVSTKITVLSAPTQTQPSDRVAPPSTSLGSNHIATEPGSWFPITLNVLLYLCLPCACFCTFPGIIYGMCAYVDISANRFRRGRLKNRVSLACAFLAVITAALVVCLMVVFWSKIKALYLPPAAVINKQEDDPLPDII